MALDLKKLRNLGGSEYGNHVVAAGSSWQAGKIATYSTDSAGNTTVTVAGTASVPVGVFKQDKATALYGVVVSEAVTFDAVNSVENLKHANVSNVRVIDSDGSTDRTAGVTVNATNGTLTNGGTGSGIAAGETVTVSYTYQKTEDELTRDGKNFFNTMDFTAGSDRAVLLQGAWRVYTDQFDSSVAYTVGATLYVGTGGVFTTTSGGKKVGIVADVPTAANAFLGAEIVVPNAANL